MSKPNKRNIFLIGMMGSGKTTIGKILAEHLEWNFDDSDHEVEHATGKSIVSIFSEKGEDHFRNLESDHLIETAQ
ncbi:MAG: shikimate kinase, partial [Dehalococcoidia bacterium]|nr:shikimate kinase [Dehalococcoidia bacterium]